MRNATTRIALALVCIAGCRGAGATKPPYDGPLRFVSAALDGSTCRLQTVNTTGPRGQSVQLTSDFTFSTTVVDGELHLHVHEARNEILAGPHEMVLRITPELVEQPENKQQVVRRAADAESTRRTIDALTGAPHVFVKLDRHAGITGYREDFDPELKVADLDGIGLAWLLGVPHLHTTVIERNEPWLGLRHLPTKQDLDQGIPLTYRVKSVRKGVATITIAADGRKRIESEELRFAGGVVIRGEATIRVADGYPLASDIELVLGFSSSEGSGGWSSRYRGSCQPR